MNGRHLLALLVPAALLAQSSRPIVTYLPDGGEIRPIYGSAMEGSIGRTLKINGTFKSIAVSPIGSFAIAIAATGEAYLLSAGGDGTIQSQQIAGVAGSEICFSPNGATAMILSDGRLRILTGLPTLNPPLASVDITSLGKASALAVSDVGEWIAGIFGGTVYAINTKGEKVPLPAPKGVTAINFFHGKSELAISTASQILRISGLEATPKSTSLFGSPDGPTPPESPFAIAATTDNNRVIILEPSGGIGQVNLENGSVTTARCDCVPNGLFQIGPSSFRLSNLAAGSVKVYDVRTGSVNTFAFSSPEPTWKDKQYFEWTESDAKEVLSGSPWVKQLVPTYVEKPVKAGKPEPAKPARPTPPTLTIRWESAQPIQEAQAKTPKGKPLPVDSKNYTILVFGVPRSIVSDAASFTEELKKTAMLRRTGKQNLRPSRVEVIQRKDGAAVMYTFSKENEITWRDATVQFEAQIADLKLSQTFNTGDMRFHAALEL